MLNEILFSGTTMIVLDSIYLKSIGATYAEQVAKIQRTAMSINYEGAIFCYILLVFGLYYFILKDRKSVLDAFLLGIVIYGVYDTTTYAVFKKWSPLLAFIDTIWGGTLFALTTMITYNFI